MIRRLVFALTLLAGLSACAAEPAAAPASAAAPAPGDDAIRKALETLLPGVTVDGIAPSPIPGFREVAIGARIVYVSDDGKRLLQGVLVDTASRENLTANSESVLRKAILEKVGPDRRIIFAAAEPRYRVTVFTDIDCAYCRHLHEQIAEYNRLGITVEYLFYPREGLGSESFDKAVAVWCAPNRQLAMTAAKAGADLPKGDCSNPVTEDYQLGRRIGLDGTPAIYAQDGTQLGGYVDPAELRTRLEKLGKPAAP